YRTLSPLRNFGLRATSSASLIILYTYFRAFGHFFADFLRLSFKSANDSAYARFLNSGNLLFFTNSTCDSSSVNSSSVTVCAIAVLYPLNVHFVRSGIGGLRSLIMRCTSAKSSINFALRGTVQSIPNTRISGVALKSSSLMFHDLCAVLTYTIK